jgi:hypothetical protein
MTLFNWGESPRGKWTFIFETKPTETVNETPDTNAGTIDSLSIVFYGSKLSENPKLEKRLATMNHLVKKAFIPTGKQIKRMYDYELKKSRESKIVNKRLIEDNPELKDILQNLELTDDDKN